MCFDRRELWRRGSPPEQLGNTLLLFEGIDQINPHLKRMLVSTMPAMNDEIIYRHTVIALIVIGFCCNPLDLKQSSDSPIYPAPAVRSAPPTTVTVPISESAEAPVEFGLSQPPGGCRVNCLTTPEFPPLRASSFVAGF